MGLFALFRSSFVVRRNHSGILIGTQTLEAGALRRSRRSEPSGQRVGEPPLGQVSHPGHVSVGPNQYGAGGSDYPERGKLPRTNIRGVDQLNAIRPFVESLQVESLLAVPLVDGEDHQGILILQQCGAPRAWRPTDSLVLKTIADQMVLAVNNSKLRNLMKTLAVTDEKSGLLKRASYIDVLLSESRRALEQNSTASVMLLHFGKASVLVKEIGEPAVENMMQQIGQNICSQLRQNDVAVRYELTTIALILPDTTDKNSFFVVEKMRKALAGVKISGSGRALTIAVGIAEAVLLQQYDPIDIVTEAINRVESALESAQAEGPNAAKSLAPQFQTSAVA